MKGNLLKISLLVALLGGGKTLQAFYEQSDGQLTCPISGPQTVHDDRYEGRDKSEVWLVISPRMPYSVLQWAPMYKSAMKQDFLVRTYRDPNVPVTEWQDAVNVSGIPSDLFSNAPSPEVLNSRLIHFPSAFVACGGKFHPWPVQGVMPLSVWDDLLNVRRKEIDCP